MCEILLLIDSQWFLFKKGEKDKICCIHKYFEQFNNALQQKNSEEKKVENFLKLSNDKDFLFAFN